MVPAVGLDLGLSGLWVGPVPAALLRICQPELYAVLLRSHKELLWQEGS